MKRLKRTFVGTVVLLVTLTLCALYRLSMS
jgi:hypothetical protein